MREKDFLSLAGVFETEVLDEPKPDPNFNPDFNKYDVVVSNMGWRAASWPEQTRADFENFVKNGGGFVSIHAADNSFPNWPAYNAMIGLGGWGDRTEDDGPYVYYNNDGELIKDESPGNAGAHGPQHEIPIQIRVKDHPITKGMPERWLTTKDECYAMLRGPAERMTILATGKDSSPKPPTDRHEPMLMVVDYGQGRVFHSTLGHDDYSMESVGFITTFVRGVEWAATGQVTQEIPDDFPTDKQAKNRQFVLKN